MAEPLLEVRGCPSASAALSRPTGSTSRCARARVHALIGPNGAGKTTLIAQLSGEVEPDAGQILFAGRDITRLPPHERVALGLARSFQITSIFRGFTALDNLALAVQARSGCSFRFWRPVAAERALVDEARRDRSQSSAWRASAGLAASSLPHGEQRPLEVGLALASRPRLLLLDEPMAGMGPRSRSAWSR